MKMIDDSKRKPNSVTNKEVVTVINLYEKGEKLSNIIDKTRISRTSIYVILKKHGVKTERQRGAERIPLKTEKRIVTMYKNGFSIAGIIESTLVSDVTIYKVLKRNREKLRKELKKETRS